MSDLRFLDYIIQGHRFDILEDIGCYPVVYNTLPSYFLYFMWPVALGIVSFFYSGTFSTYLRVFLGIQLLSRSYTTWLLDASSAIRPTCVFKLFHEHESLHQAYELIYHRHDVHCTPWSLLHLHWKQGCKLGAMGFLGGYSL